MSLPNQWNNRIQTLPVLPQVALRITERIQSPTATVQEIADLIRSDMGLSASILRLANSSYYSIPGGVSDISKALQYLGFTTIAQSVLTSSFFGSFKTAGISSFPLSPFWKHSFAVGLLSELTAQSLQLKNSADVFIAGLMHDVGKVVLLEISSEDLSKIISHAESHECSFLDAELALGLPPHTEIGAELGKYWKLPSSIIQAIASHHGPYAGSENQKSTTENKVIEWANLAVQCKEIGHSGNHRPPQQLQNAETIAREALEISDLQYQSIFNHFEREFEKAEALLHGH